MKKDKQIPFLIEIVSCKVSTYWYHDKIGMIMFVVKHRTEEGKYSVVDLISNIEEINYRVLGFSIDISDTIISKSWKYE